MERCEVVAGIRSERNVMWDSPTLRQAADVGVKIRILKHVDGAEYSALCDVTRLHPVGVRFASKFKFRPQQNLPSDQLSH